jgi:hypothetical protein
MARIRTFKAELFHDEKLIQCSPEARLLFLGLFPHCDDLGRLQYSHANLKGKVFPADDISPQMVGAMVDELAEAGVIELYQYRENPNSKRPQLWLRLPHFLRHQVIDRPSHCTSPPSPTETDPVDRLCRCANPKCSEARQLAQLAKNNGRRPKVFRTEHSEDSTSARDSGSARRVIDEDSLGKGREWKGVSTLHGKSREDIYTRDTPEFEVIPPQTFEPQEHEENRRTESAVVDELARGILTRLGIVPTANILNTLAKSIEVRSRSRACTIELSAASILARSAGVSSEARPDNWEQWFADVRYDYVNAGDPSLLDRRIWARETCGGPRCEDGWETVTVDGKQVARRCPDCVALWPEE